jgi:hypothetical protein
MLTPTTTTHSIRTHKPTHPNDSLKDFFPTMAIQPNTSCANGRCISAQAAHAVKAGVGGWMGGGRLAAGWLTQLQTSSSTDSLPPQPQHSAAETRPACACCLLVTSPPTQPHTRHPLCMHTCPAQAHINSPETLAAAAAETEAPLHEALFIHSE